MTITNPRRANVQVYCRDEALREIDRLVAASGMPLVELKALGHEYRLNAELRSILADIEGLEWMLGCLDLANARRYGVTAQGG